MKKTNIILLLLVILTSITNCSKAQNTNNSKSSSTEKLFIEAKIDKRTELFTIVSRLAEFKEYSPNYIKKYVNDVDAYFKDYKNHPAILYLKELRKEHGLGYDAIMTMTVHLGEAPELQPRIPLKEAFYDNGLDNRWGDVNTATKFINLLQQFYKDTDFDSFFASQSRFYSAVENRLQTEVNKIDFEWYRRFYGELPDGKLYLYILLDSGGNYGAEVRLSETKRDIYALLTTSRIDDEGLPVYGKWQLATLIHEFSHPFINPIFFADKNKFKASGEKIFNIVKDRLGSRGYGNWESVITESLTNASVIRYLIEHEKESEVIYDKATRDLNGGFIWVDEIVALFGAYEENRDMYPNFKSFMPFIEGYFTDLSNRIELKSETFEKLVPNVTRIVQFENGAQDVDPALSELTIEFDKLLNTTIKPRVSNVRNAKGTNPVDEVIGLNDLGTTLKLKVILVPNTEYEFELSGRNFKSKNGYVMKSYKIQFKTKK